MTIPKIIYLIIALTTLASGDVPVEEGIVYIPGTGNSPNPTTNAVREGSNGYLSFTLEYANCVDRGATFLGLESGVGIGINGIDQAMRKELFSLDADGDKRIFFFNRSKKSKNPNRVKDQPMHSGYVPVGGIQKFQFVPLIFLADDPKGDQENYLNKILNDSAKVGETFAINEIGAIVKVATLATDTLIDIFDLREDRFHLKDPSPPLQTLGIDETQISSNTLRTGRYLIFSKNFSRFFNRNTIQRRYHLNDDWRIEDADWSINNSRQLCLSGKSIPMDDAYMIIKVEWTDTIFKKGSTDLRLSNPPNYLSKGSALQNAITEYEKSMDALELTSYSPGSVLTGLKNASDSYDSLLIQLKSVKYLDPLDSKSLEQLTKNRILDKTLQIINKKHADQIFEVEALKVDWKEIFKRKLLVDCFGELPKEPSQEAKGTWLLRAREILDTPPVKS